MKKQLFQFTLRLLILIVAVAAASTLFLQWIGYFDNETYVAYLYESTEFNMVEIDQLTALFAETDAPFQSSPLYGDPADRVASAIEKGANTIILNLADAPSDELIALAAEYDVTLFFVGALPTDQQIASYDKLWGFTESTAYAGELLGEQVALAFRDGVITDKNSDLLLDYVFLNTYETYMETEETVASTLLELDHYGVYTTDVYAAAYNSALYLAELSAAGYLEEEVDPDGEYAEGSEESSDTDSADAESEEPADDEDTATEEEAAETDEEGAENVLEVTVDFANLSSTEVMMSVGSANAIDLANQAIAQGWLSGATPVVLACIVENVTVAHALSETGNYYSIVYFDTSAATETVAEMAYNAWRQTPVTNGTNYAENTAHTFVVAHQIYQ